MRWQRFVAILAALTAIVAADPLALADDAGPRIVNPPSLDAPVASAAVSARRVVLARSFYLIVRVVYAPGIEVSLPTNLDFGAPSLIEELRRTDVRQENPDGSITREFELEVMAFVTGQLTIPPIEVTYTGRGERSVVRTNPIAFEVSGVIGSSPGELRDIAPPVDVLRRDYTLAYIATGIVVGLIVLGLIIFLIYHLVRRKTATAYLVAHRILPPDEEALARFAAIEARGDLETADQKLVYLEMSEILKSYIARRFGFPASELTTLEIRNELAARPQGERAEAMIRGWLEAADLVKFANQKASPDDARRALYEARTFVETTRRDVDPPSPSPVPPVDDEGEEIHG